MDFKHPSRTKVISHEGQAFPAEVEEALGGTLELHVAYVEQSNWKTKATTPAAAALWEFSYAYLVGK